VHRALIDLKNWKLLKWLDEPAPFFDWRSSDGGPARVHPTDTRHMARMTTEFASGMTAAVLRMRATDGSWHPIHLTINRIELEPGTFAGLVALRAPTQAEIAAADLDDIE
jgi:hypothetical protein